MDVQPSNDSWDRQAIPINPSPTKKSKVKAPPADPGVPPREAKIAREAALRRQRKLLRSASGKPAANNRERGC
jgi:hypothetical protein